MIYCLPDRILDGILEDYQSPRTTLNEYLKQRIEEEMEILEEFETEGIVIEHRSVHECSD